MELVTQNFWWPGVIKEVKQYVEGCDSCQRNKNCTEQPVGKLIPNSIPEKSWMYISADFITTANSTRIQLNLSGSRLIDKNSPFHPYYRENIGRRAS